MSFTERAVKQRKASPWIAAFNLIRGIAFATVEVLAALALDGWLPWALLAMAAYTVVYTAIGLGGMIVVAVEAMNQTGRRP
jgi:hypothetical protein